MHVSLSSSFTSRPEFTLELLPSEFNFYGEQEYEEVKDCD